MTGVETIARIRFEHYQNGKGIKRIARELGIARDTVRKALRSTPPPSPTSARSSRGPSSAPRAGPDARSCGASQAQTRAPLDAAPVRGLAREGYGGGYDSVRRYARRWREERARAPVPVFIPLAFAPGRGLPVRLEPRDRALDGLR